MSLTWPCADRCCSSQASSYDILMVYDQVPTLGLLDNMVYDVIPTVPSAVGNTTVNASVYEVNCAALQDVPHPLTAFDTLPRHGQPNITWLEFQIGERDGLQANVFATLPCMVLSIIFVLIKLMVEFALQIAHPLYTRVSSAASILRTRE